MKFTKRLILGFGVVAIMPFSAIAQEFTLGGKTVILNVGFKEGSVTDRLTRLL